MLGIYHLSTQSERQLEELLLSCSYTRLTSGRASPAVAAWCIFKYSNPPCRGCPIEIMDYSKACKTVLWFTCACESQS